MKINTKKLHPLAIIPKYQTQQAAGFDFHTTEPVTVMPGETKLVPTGLAVAVPEGFELQVRPRSGLSAKTGIRVANAPGTVDSDYRGEIKVILHNTGEVPFFISVGDRIAQGVICPVFRAEFEEVEELGQTERGAGAFGSTGVK
jgi:dUTP pyrophosphatase